MNISKIKAGVTLALFAGSMSYAGIADFYSMTSEGELYLVDGSTFNATHVVDLEVGTSVNEIMYLSDGGILVNNGRDLIRYDIDSGEQRTVFDGSGLVGDITYLTGMAATSDGDIFMSAFGYFADGQSEYYGATYDPFSGEFNLLDRIGGPSGLYFDHHQVGESLYLGADWGGEQISVIDLFADETVFYDVDFKPVSFFDSNGEVFAIGQFGKVFSFDILTGESVQHGRININGSFDLWIGAASTSAPFVLPAPSSLAFLSFAGIAATRRRR